MKATVMNGDSDALERAGRWVRAACWIGAVVDAGAAIQMLFPRVFAFAYRPTDFHPGPDYRFAMGMGASLMIGWTALLLWASRRPIERRGVLLLTAVAVGVGLVPSELAGIADGFVPVLPLVPVFALQVVLVTLFVWSARMAGRAERQKEVSYARLP